MENKKERTLEQTMDGLRDYAMKLFSDAESGWREYRVNAVADSQFFHGNQWDDNLLAIARIKREPTLQVNRLPQFVKQIENELRQRDMAITAAATDEAGSDETAQILTGIIRGIEQRSNATSHYIHAAGENGAMVPGIGYLKVEVNFADNQLFDQDIWIKSIKDPMKVLPDPAAMEPDFSDAEYWFEFEDYQEKVFKRNFPQATCTSSEMFPIGARMSSWLGDKTIRVARFWYKEYTSITNYLMDDGTVVIEEQVESIEDCLDENNDNYGKKLAFVDGQQKVILRERQITSTKIKWVDFTGAEVLNEGEWAGSMFPFVAVTGPISIVDGKKDVRGIIRFAKDSQKMLNYMASSAARRIASANKSPWIVDMKSIANYKQAWNRANTDNMPYLPYDAFDPNRAGNPNPPPQRADQTGQIQDLLAAAAKFENDLKATIGIYDAGLGATPNEQSGIAIKTLAQQGQNANFHYSDALATALKHLGDILIDLIPRIYDTPRIVKAVSADSKARLVKINQITQEKGKLMEYNIRDAAGHYGVTVNVGPAYATQKQAAIEQMTELMRINPNIAPYVQDIIAGNMDFEGKEVVRNRLLKVLAIQAPMVIEDPEVEDVPPQAVAKIQQQNAIILQLQQQMEALTTEYQKAAIALQTKSMEHEQSIQKAQYDAQLQAALQAQKANNEKEIEAMRAAREARIAASEMEMTAIKAQLSHTEKMMGLVMDAMKQFGTGADEVVANIMPPIDKLADDAANS
jgi:hypothetical protein